jgi:hypothetical protein
MVSRRKSRVPPGRRSGQFRRIAEPGDQVRIGMLVRQSWPVQVIQQAPDVPAAEHFPNHRNTPAPSRDIPAHVFRRLTQPADHSRTKLCRREQILTALSRGIQPSHRLIQIRPTLRTRPAADISSTRASRNGALILACRPRAAAIVTSAANAPRASPAWPAASSSWASSSSVRKNLTRRGHWFNPSVAHQRKCRSAA